MSLDKKMLLQDAWLLVRQYRYNGSRPPEERLTHEQRKLWAKEIVDVLEKLADVTAKDVDWGGMEHVVQWNQQLKDGMRPATVKVRSPVRVRLLEPPAVRTRELKGDERSR